MEQFDSEKVRRVWQRVQAGAAAPQQETGLLDLTAGEMGESGACMRLARFLKGRDHQILRQMAMEDQHHGQVLRGICRLTEGVQIPKIPPVQDSGTMAQRLHLCYGRKMRLAAEYEKRISDPQFGHIFKKMAEQEQSHCRTLLSLIGKY